MVTQPTERVQEHPRIVSCTANRCGLVFHSQEFRVGQQRPCGHLHSSLTFAPVPAGYERRAAYQMWGTGLMTPRTAAQRWEAGVRTWAANLHTRDLRTVLEHPEETPDVRGSQVGVAGYAGLALVCGAAYAALVARGMCAESWRYRGLKIAAAWAVPQRCAGCGCWTSEVEAAVSRRALGEVRCVGCVPEPDPGSCPERVRPVAGEIVDVRPLVAAGGQ